MKKLMINSFIAIAVSAVHLSLFSMNNGFVGHGFTPPQLAEIATFSAAYGQLKFSIESDKDAHTAYAHLMASLGNPSYTIVQESKTKLLSFGIDPDQMNPLKIACIAVLNEK